MYIVAIGWLWVALMMSLTETSLSAGLLSFFFYGLAPLALFLWLVGTPARRRHSRRAAPRERRAPLGGSERSERGGGFDSAGQAIDQEVGKMDRGDARRDE